MAKVKKKTVTKKAKIKKPKKTVKAKASSRAKAKASLIKPKKIQNKKSTKTKPKKLTKRQILKKVFAQKKPKKLFLVKQDDQSENFSAPPIIKNPKSAKGKKIKNLLLKKFNLETVIKTKNKKKAKAKPKKTTVPKKKLEISDGVVKSSITIGLSSNQNVKTKKTKNDIFFTLVITVVIAFAAVFWASVINENTYYLKPIGKNLEIWQGVFAPCGIKKIDEIDNYKHIKKTKKLYPKLKAFSFICNNFINKADLLSKNSDIPDFTKIDFNLNKSFKYALTDKLKKNVTLRIDKIKYIVLIYKADVAAQSNDESGMKKALKYYKKALKLSLNNFEEKYIKDHIKFYQDKLSMEKK